MCYYDWKRHIIITHVFINFFLSPTLRSSHHSFLFLIISEFLFRLDELKNKFLENNTDADLLSEIRAQLDNLDETTADPIQKSLIDGLKSFILKK